jgi:hypothetical protein
MYFVRGTQAKRKLFWCPVNFSSLTGYQNSFFRPNAEIATALLGWYQSGRGINKTRCKNGQCR